MNLYPEDKITRPRTVTDSIYAIVVSRMGKKRHVQPSSVGVGKLNYLDQVTGTGTQAVEVHIGASIGDSERASGTINGVNTTFTCATAYTSDYLAVYRNGVLQVRGAAKDWTETSPAAGTFDFVTAPLTGNVVSYMILK